MAHYRKACGRNVAEPGATACFQAVVETVFAAIRGLSAEVAQWDPGDPQALLIAPFGLQPMRDFLLRLIDFTGRIPQVIRPRR